MFQSTRPARGATAARHLSHVRGVVSIHAPRTGRDNLRQRRSAGFHVSIHAPRTGRDDNDIELSNPMLQFQSTRPARGATNQQCTNEKDQQFQSTRPARGATMVTSRIRPAGPRVSIHAPRTGRDHRGLPNFLFHRVSIHAPRTGRDSVSRPDYRAFAVSIHAPRTGRDVRLLWPSARNRCFNPRAPHGARPCGTGNTNIVKDVSIHAPRTGRDRNRGRIAQRIKCFNPRAPHGARPVAMFANTVARLFQSTRPARGATSTSSSPAQASRSFNPRAPHGARPAQNRDVSRPSLFQSTRPARGATIFLGYMESGSDVSIHAPRTGRDRPCLMSPPTICVFQSTRPARGATSSSRRIFTGSVLFQSTRPARGATWQPESDLKSAGCFNPRAPHGARPPIDVGFNRSDNVSIHAPRTGRDRIRKLVPSLATSFNPRAPHGARPALL